MDGFGQAMPFASSTSGDDCQRLSLFRRVILPRLDALIRKIHGEGVVYRTQRSMLERECHNVLDTLERHRWRIARKAFADDDLDSTDIVARIPVLLIHEVLLERWKLEEC